MFKLFKKKEKPVIERHDFLAHIHTRNMGVHKVIGYYESANDLATRLSFLIDNFDSFTTTRVDGDSLVIRSKDIEFIRVEEKPYEA
jgi:hypothetical protein